MLAQSLLLNYLCTIVVSPDDLQNSICIVSEFRRSARNSYHIANLICTSDSCIQESNNPI